MSQNTSMGRLFWFCLAVLLAAFGGVAFIVATEGGFSAAMDRVQGVARVERLVSPWRPKCRIIHIADYHLVNQKDSAADLRDQDPDVTDADIVTEHQRIVATVRKVQANQVPLIRWLAKERGVRAIYLEGLMDGDEETYAAMVRLVEKHKLDPSRIGAAGQALMAGDIEAVLPPEGETARLAAERGPLQPAANQAREQAIFMRLVQAGQPIIVLVLGVGHDLTPYAKAGDCEYIKVYVEGVDD